MRTTPVLLAALSALSALLPDTAGAIPYFARRYGVTCQTCHVSPPKLNAFGEGFRDRGYRMPPGFEARPTVPFAIWASVRSDALHDEREVDEAVRAYVNRLEVISGGRLAAPWLSYFVEWRPLSLETQRRDGRIRLRDRSGRFEDIFLTAVADRLDVTVGQFRQVSQVDVSLRLGLSEPLVLAASLPGSAGGLPRDTAGQLSPAGSRRLSLRGFSPAGRSPAVRVGWNQPVLDGWSLRASAAIPFPGEFSVPLTREARREASNELEEDPKGVFLESFLRRGLTSIGAHAFYDGPERFLVQAVTTGNRGALYWTGITGLAKTGGNLRGRWSVEGEYVPHYHFGIGGRVEDRAGDRTETAFVPYLSLQFPGTRYTFRFTAERRFQEGSDLTLLELGTVF